MYILRPVELRWSTWPDTIRPESLYCLLLDLFVTDEIIEVVGCQVRDGAAI